SYAPDVERAFVTRSMGRHLLHHEAYAFAIPAGIVRVGGDRTGARQSRRSYRPGVIVTPGPRRPGWVVTRSISSQGVRHDSRALQGSPERPGPGPGSGVAPDGDADLREAPGESGRCRRGRGRADHDGPPWCRDARSVEHAAQVCL